MSSPKVPSPPELLSDTLAPSVHLPCATAHIAPLAGLLGAIVAADAFLEPVGIVPWIQFALATAVFLLGRDLLGQSLQPLLGRGQVRPATPLVVAAVAAYCYSFITMILAARGQLASGHALLTAIPEAAASSASGTGASGVALLETPRLFFTCAAAILVGLVLGRAALISRLEVLRDEATAPVPGGSGATRLEVAGRGAAASSSHPLAWPSLGRQLDGMITWIVMLFVLGAAGLVWLARGLDGGVVALLLSSCVVAIPGGLELAARLARQVGVVRLRSLGCRFRDSAVIDRLAGLDLLVFKKFKTLTAGCPQVTDVMPLGPGISPDEVLYLASALIYRTDHPMRDAILLRSSDICRTIPHIKDYHVISGRGVQAVFQGQDLILGNLRFLADSGIECSGAEERVRELAAEGKSVLVLAMSGRVVGVLAIHDDLRGECKETLDRIRRLRVRTALVSGDHAAAVDAIGARLGFDEAHADLTPDDVSRRVRELRSGGRRMGMVSHSTIDAALLSELEVGIAFGIDPDAPLRANEIHVEGGDARRIAEIVETARRCRRCFRAHIVALGVYYTLVASILLAPFVTPMPDVLGGLGIGGRWSSLWLGCFAVVATLAPAAMSWCAGALLRRWQRQRAAL